jgi:hypothetical protein
MSEPIHAEGFRNIGKNAVRQTVVTDAGGMVGANLSTGQLEHGLDSKQRNDMKKTLLTIALGLAMALTAANAQAITLAIDDALYVGSVDPGSPASLTDEAAYINFLLGMAAPSTDTDDPAGPPPTVYTYTRSDNTCASLGGCVAATAVGATQNPFPGSDITNLNLSGWTYLLAKYGNTSYVWYVSGQTDVTLANPLGGEETNGLSHYSLFNPGTVTTPDGGATAGLLGLAMLGLGYLRRRKA